MKRGAKVLAGGSALKERFEKGWFMEATVLSDGRRTRAWRPRRSSVPRCPSYREGPRRGDRQGQRQRVRLGSSIWTKDLAKARKAAELLEAGYTWINDIQVAYDQLPFGGTKQSGFGKEHGIEGLDGYLEKKSVVLAY